MKPIDYNANTNQLWLATYTNLSDDNPHGMAASLSLYARRYQSRKGLLKLNDDLLRDIGLTREQALSEAAKPFWR